MTKLTETDQIQSKIDALQKQLATLEAETPIDANGTPEEILAAAAAAVTRQQGAQATRKAIASLITALNVKEQAREQKERAKSAEAGLEAIKRQAQITATKLEEAQDALDELTRMAAPHLRSCQETFGQLALQNRLDRNAGFPAVEIWEKCVVVSTKYS